jgi:hypothetical protein
LGASSLVWDYLDKVKMNLELSGTH